MLCLSVSRALALWLSGSLSLCRSVRLPGWMAGWLSLIPLSFFRQGYGAGVDPLLSYLYLSLSLSPYTYTYIYMVYNPHLNIDVDVDANTSIPLIWR